LLAAEMAEVHQNDMKARIIIMDILIILVAVIIVAIVATYTSSLNREQVRATAEYLSANPVPTPDFVLGVRFDTSEQGDRSCIFISQGALWESGDGREELKSHIVSNTQFFVDGNEIKTVAISESGMIPQDETGALTSDFGSTLQFCYGFHIEGGLHLAQLISSSLSGNQYSYSWAIEKQ
jgi:hypothetical protein